MQVSFNICHTCTRWFLTTQVLCARKGLGHSRSYAGLLSPFINPALNSQCKDSPCLNQLFCIYCIYNMYLWEILRGFLLFCVFTPFSLSPPYTLLILQISLRIIALTVWNRHHKNHPWTLNFSACPTKSSMSHDDDILGWSLAILLLFYTFCTQRCSMFS